MNQSSDLYSVSAAVPPLKQACKRGGGALLKVGDEFRSFLCMPSSGPWPFNIGRRVQCTLTIKAVHWPDHSLPPVPGSVISRREYGPDEHDTAIRDLLAGAKPDDCISIGIEV